MRETLGVALDNYAITTALVDADTPRLGAIDQFRHQWGIDGSVPSAQSSARALCSAVAAATERATRSQLHPTSVGVMCARADVRDLLPELLGTRESANLEMVSIFAARLAYLRTVDALVGFSSILAFWLEGDEIVIAAVDLSTGALDSAHRYDSTELLSNSAIFVATLDSIVAKYDQDPTMLVAMGIPEEPRETCAEAAELAGLGFTFLGEPTQLAIGAALVAATPTGQAFRTADGVRDGTEVSSIAHSPKCSLFAVFTTLIVLGGMLIGLLFALAPAAACG